MANCEEAPAQAKKILIVEDDAAVREMIAFTLARHGYQSVQAGDAITAQASIASDRPSVAIVDWVLPGMSGVDLTRLIKKSSTASDIAVIILTGRASEEDKVLGLESGADDYVTKPFSSRELLARINAVLRGISRLKPADVIRADGMVLDPESQRVSVGGSVVALAPTEFRLLSFLMTHPERVYSREQLVNRVWGPDARVAPRTIDVEISRLRRMLEQLKCHAYIQTVRGTGYRFSTRTH